MLLALPLLDYSTVKVFELRMLRLVLVGLFKSLTLIEQGTNARVILYRRRLFFGEQSWAAMINRATQGTSCPYQ